jgi:Zn-dependent protease
LFRVAGIDVFVHWSWLLVAVLELRSRTNHYTSQVWNVAEYLALFGIVLLHEFGHALACRQVGGRAHQIFLWPLGGVAVVNPPPRPGALLWSIAAGPLVNVLLVPVTLGLSLLGAQLGLSPDAQRFFWMLTAINICLLVFNLLPIYPLDGGQIVQALLWFVVGRVKSLTAVSLLGMAVAAAVLGLAVMAAMAGTPFVGNPVWLGILAAFVAWRSWAGLKQAQALSMLLSRPRHETAACPACGAPPIQGEFWVCNRCATQFDTFVHQATCPQCGQVFAQTKCLECHQSNPMAVWIAHAPVEQPTPEEAGVGG